MEHLGRGPVAQGMMGPTLAHSPPSHSSKTVLSTVHVGGLIAALIEGEGKGVDGFGAVEGWCDGVSLLVWLSGPEALLFTIFQEL